MIQVICNPTAGNGRGRRIGAQVERALKAKGIEHTYIETLHAGHATQLAQQATRAGIETVLAVGGDGTALEVARGLYSTKTAMGIIPAGTGNDFIKCINIPKKPMAALEYVLNCKPKATDVGLINGRVFLNVSGTGFDVMVLDYALKAKKYCRGMLPYLYGVLCAIFKFQAMDLTFQMDDGEKVTLKAMICAVGNGRIIGGGIPITPEASIDDGLLDITLIREIKRKSIPRYLPGLLGGKVLTFSQTSQHRVKTICFSAPHMRLNIDGEITTADEAVIHVQPAALRILR